jgi:glycosyltransferase involved in cell wall biosynthesis
MKICYFGIYNPQYSRNRVLLKGLKQNNIEIIECIVDPAKEKRISKYFYLILKHWKIRNDYDILLVGHPCQQSMILARLLTRKRIILDLFHSIYDQKVNDFKVLRKVSIGSFYYWILEWMDCKAADTILCDTKSHLDYYIKTFKVDKKKFIVVPVGTDDEIMKPMENKRNNDKFVVHFHGTYIPLQGVDYLMKAAEMLIGENIVFNIVGSKIRNIYGNQKIVNVNFLESVPYEKLADLMSQADICLGIFGDTEKAKRVIPNKVYEAIACRKAVVTGRSEAINEIFEDRNNILLCNMTDPADLAEKIRELKGDKDLRSLIANNGYNIFLDRLTPQKIVKELINKIQYE